MLQQSLLFNFKIKINTTKNINPLMNYNIVKGIWELNDGYPFVKAMLNDKNHDYGATLVTATREGIDRSENS